MNKSQKLFLFAVANGVAMATIVTFVMLVIDKTELKSLMSIMVSLIALFGLIFSFITYYFRSVDIKEKEIGNADDASFDSTENVNSDLTVIDSHFKGFKKEIESIKDELKKYRARLASSDYTEQDKAEFKKALTDEIKTKSYQKVVDEIKSQIPKSEEQIKRTEEQLRRVRIANNVFESSKRRLDSEIEKLEKRGRLNLTIGVFVTVIGLVMLGVILLAFDTPTNDVSVLLAKYLPRIAFVVLIEIFALFFLKLYRNSLTDIKFYQNEITNIESKFTGLRICMSLDEKDVSEKILDSLLNTERNFILEKGQSTIDLKKAKYEKDLISEIVKAVSDTIKK